MPTSPLLDNFNSAILLFRFVLSLYRTAHETSIESVLEACYPGLIFHRTCVPSYFQSYIHFLLRKYRIMPKMTKIMILQTP